MEEEGLGLQDAKRLELIGGVGIGETVGMGRGFGIACTECLSVCQCCGSPPKGSGFVLCCGENVGAEEGLQEL